MNHKILSKVQEEKDKINDLKKHIKDLEMELEFMYVREPDEIRYISDLENKEGSVFPQDVLKDIILSYNNTAQKFMPDLLSKTFEVFRQQQENFLKAF